MPERHAAFLSYAHRYGAWVKTLQGNLERSLAHLGRPGSVFLDQVDLGAGRSWVGQLQAGLDQAERLILVATPEALASPRVADEWETFVARRRDWRQGNLQIVLLVDTPLPPFLDGVQRVDFRRGSEAQHRLALQELLSGLLGREDRRDLPTLPAGIEIPAPPDLGLAEELRGRLVAWLAPVLRSKMRRLAVATGLRLESNALEGHPSAECAASAALVLATGKDDPIQATLRILDVLAELVEEEDLEGAAALAPLRAEVEELRGAGPERGLLRVYLEAVDRDHAELVPYFQRQAELAMLDRVYVQLELRPDERGFLAREGAEGGLLRPMGLRELLELEPAEHRWLTRRWVVRGDPGAGKTTLLRHLAATLAREEKESPRSRRVPVFESLPRLMREGGRLLDRIARRLERAGHPAQGLQAVLDRAGQEGRLVLLFDGLDEVPKEERDEAEKTLRDMAALWSSSALVVTTRPIGYRRLGSEFLELDLLPLDVDRRREFLARWFGRRSGAPDFERAARELSALEEDPGLRELAGNPLYLTLMALLLEKGTSPDRNRTRLYDQVFELLLEGKHRPEGEPIDCQAGVREILRHLGYGMTRDNRDTEPVTALEARLYQPAADPLRAPLERVPRWRASLRTFLDDLSRKTGILGPHDGPDADWRFWHRTFREALAAERLEQIAQHQGTEAVLALAREVAGDESRWAEPYALLTGRIADPDGLVRALVEANRSLGLRALATAPELRPETLTQVLVLTEKWQERAEVYRRLPELVGDPERALALLDRLRRRTRDGNDLYFLDLAVRSVGERWPDQQRKATDLLTRLFDHIPAPPKDLFQWIDTPLDGRIPLWRDIPAGRFWMGSPEGEGDDDEHPCHEVVLAAPFRIGAVPVTNEQYAAFDPGYHPELWEGVSTEELLFHPAVNITWFAAVSFCRWLSTRAPWARGARLPLEEEWEYACRAGTETRYWSGDEEADLARVGWYDENSGSRTHRVGEKPASPWGLYDVHGNVWEWTVSPFAGRYEIPEGGVVLDSAAVEPLLVTEPGGGGRVLRGGTFWDGAGGARAAYRNVGNPGFVVRDLGFRVVLPGGPHPRPLSQLPPPFPGRGEKSKKE